MSSLRNETLFASNRGFFLVNMIVALPLRDVIFSWIDDPAEKIELKTFHCEIINDHEALKKEVDNYVSIP